MAVAVNEHFASVFTKEENTVGVSPNKIRLRFSEPNIDKGKVIEMLTAFTVDKWHAYEAAERSKVEDKDTLAIIFQSSIDSEVIFKNGTITTVMLLFKKGLEANLVTKKPAISRNANQEQNS